ncbi:hypothetical protein WN51_12505 [Melipona quadrifasciata]|uniref:Uncharacterized protein n=1 Tax=Melipona quadrifasciata TaxID=166423 RepID=A0A0N0BHC0_9HYME|nr:hypothetical protein WN51_12505 [Melipona quadrifasciata]
MDFNKEMTSQKFFTFHLQFGRHLKKNFGNEVIFVRGKLNATECQKMLRDNLSCFVTEIEDNKKAIFQQNFHLQRH